eukprot:6491767-Amphidinium_carterae.1
MRVAKTHASPATSTETVDWSELADQVYGHWHSPTQADLQREHHEEYPVGERELYQHFADAFADANRAHQDDDAGVDMGGFGHGVAEYNQGYSPPPFGDMEIQGQGQKRQQEEKPFKIWRRVRGKQSEDEVKLRQGRRVELLPSEGGSQVGDVIDVPGQSNPSVVPDPENLGNDLEPLEVPGTYWDMSALQRQMNQPTDEICGRYPC